jgi:hypothetical protein
MVNLQQTAVFFTTTEATFTISSLNPPPSLKFTIAQMKRLQELLERAGLSIKDLPDDVE